MLMDVGTETVLENTINKIEVIIAKNYSGGLTNEKLAYQPEFKAFQNLYVEEDY